MFKTNSISQKLFIAFLLVSSFSSIIYTYFIYHQTKTAIIERTLDQLTSIKILKKGWLEQYFESRNRDTRLFASLYSTRNSFKQLEDAYLEYGIQSKQYKEADSTFGYSMRSFKLNNHFKNVWLIDTTGRVFYTTVKNKYYGKNIFSYKGINPTFIDFLKNSVYSAGLIDLPFIDSASKIPYIILTHPVLTEDKKRTAGVLLVKLDIDDINHILTQRTGMGQTGESYVVNELFLMRSKSRFINNTHENPLYVHTEATHNALKGISGVKIIKDYRDIDVLSSYIKLEIQGLQWALMSEIDVEEAMQPVYLLRNQIIGILVVINILIVLVTLILASTIAQPIKKLNKIIKQLGEGKLVESSGQFKSQDEIGQMAEAIENLVLSLRKTAKFANEIGRGNFQTDFKPLSHEDVTGYALLDMRNKLRELNALIENQNKIRTKSIIEGQENERRRISRELHDGVGQMLTALKFKVQELQEDEKVVPELKQLLDDTIQEVRRASVNLVPSVLYDFGLEPALKILVKITELDTEFSFEAEENVPDIPLEKRLCIYRIAQESLQNIQKYAKSAKVDIRILHSEDSIRMKISDTGPGFDMDTYKNDKSASNGLRNMRDRAEIEGGTFEIDTILGIGTTIKVYLPL